MFQDLVHGFGVSEKGIVWHSESSGLKCSLFFFFFIYRFYLFIFRERGREGEREGEKHQCVVASCVAPTRDLACNPGMCPDRELIWWPFGSQASTQSTEPHWPGPAYSYRGWFIIKVTTYLFTPGNPVCQKTRLWLYLGVLFSLIEKLLFFGSPRNRGRKS